MLRVRVEAQLEVDRAVTRADSRTKSLRLARRPSASRSSSFSLLAASPSRAFSSSSAIWLRSRWFSSSSSWYRKE